MYAQSISTFQVLKLSRYALYTNAKDALGIKMPPICHHCLHVNAPNRKGFHAYIWGFANHKTAGLVARDPAVVEIRKKLNGHNTTSALGMIGARIGKALLLECVHFLQIEHFCNKH